MVGFATINTTLLTTNLNYDNASKLWKRLGSIPKDPRKTAKYLDEVMLSAYHVNGHQLFDDIRMSKRHIHNAQISVIASLQRANEISSITPQEVLSPEQMYQKVVMCAALGIKRFGLWRGLYIDGSFHLAFGKASRLIWSHEKFYYHGKSIHKQVKVIPQINTNSTDYAYTAQKAGEKKLVTLFNFTNKPLQFTVSIKGAPKKQTKVLAYGVKLIEQ